MAGRKANVSSRSRFFASDVSAAQAPGDQNMRLSVSSRRTKWCHRAAAICRPITQ